MDWIKLLIPLIAIAVWILSHLASSQREQREQPRRPPPRPSPPDQDNPGRPRSSSAELESFLEEMRQRKQYEKDQPAEAVVVKEAPRPKPPPPLPRRDDRRDERREDRRDERRKSRPVGSRPPQRRTEPVIVVTPEPAAPLSPRAAAPRAAAPTITAGATPMPLTLSVAPPTVGAASLTGPFAVQHVEVPWTQAPPVARMVTELLRNRQTLPAAFLLREILDRPLSQRPRRRR
jgi:hypothetical protein